MRSFTNYMVEAAPRNRVLQPAPDAKQVERDLAKRDVPMRKAAGAAAAAERQRQGKPQPSKPSFDQDYKTIDQAAPLETGNVERAGQAIDMIKQAKDRERRAKEARGETFDDSLQARMDRAARIAGPMGVLNRQRGRNQAMQGAGLRGAGADVPAPERVNVGRDREGNERGVDVGRVAGHRHLFQPELDKDYEDFVKLESCGDVISLRLGYP